MTVKIEHQPDNLAVIAHAFAKQASRDVTFSKVTLSPEYSNGTTTATAMNNKLNPHKLPAFPLVDYLEGSAMAVNDPDADYRDCSVADVSSNHNRSFAQAALYNNVNNWQYGYRTPNSTADIPPLQFEVLDSEAQDMDIDTEEYYSQMSSALYGYKALDPEVLQANTLARRNLGDITRARRHGYDKFANPSIFGSPAQGLPFSVSPGIAISNEKFRVNDTLVGPVMTAKNVITQ